jgi:hypothetical protein
MVIKVMEDTIKDINNQQIMEVIKTKVIHMDQHRVVEVCYKIVVQHVLLQPVVVVFVTYVAEISLKLILSFILNFIIWLYNIVYALIHIYLKRSNCNISDYIINIYKYYDN